jgi:hypothetical protein
MALVSDGFWWEFGVLGGRGERGFALYTPGQLTVYNVILIFCFRQL